MSPLRVYTYTNVKRCSHFEKLHILSFYRIEEDKSCHLYVYIHTPTSNLWRCSCFAQLHILSFYRIEIDKSCHLYVSIHTPTSNVACTLLHTLSFYRIEADKVCHLCVYIHKSSQTSHVTSTCIYIHQHQTLLVFCATTYSVILQDRGRQVLSPLRVYTYTNIKRGLYFATHSVILQNRGRQGMSPLRVYTYTNVKRCLYFAQWHILPFYKPRKTSHVYIRHSTDSWLKSMSPLRVCSTESRQTSHVTSTCIYIHQHQTLFVLCAMTYSAILQNRGRQVMSPLQ